MSILETLKDDLKAAMLNKDEKKKNIIRAVSDPSILRKEQTRVVPVVRPQSADKFVAPTVVAPISIDHEGVAVQTAPILAGKKFNLIALGQHDQLPEMGISPPAASISTSIRSGADWML